MMTCGIMDRIARYGNVMRIRKTPTWENVAGKLEDRAERAALVPMTFFFVHGSAWGPGAPHAGAPVTPICRPVPAA